MRFFFNKPPFILSGTATIIILSFVVRTMPIGIRAGVAGLQQIDPGLEEASANLGASSSQTLKKKWLYRYCVPLFFAGALKCIYSLNDFHQRRNLFNIGKMAAFDGGDSGGGRNRPTRPCGGLCRSLDCLDERFYGGLLRFGLNRLGKTPTDLSC